MAITTARRMERYGLLERLPGWLGRPYRWRIPGAAHLPEINLWVRRLNPAPTLPHPSPG